MSPEPAKLSDSEAVLKETEALEGALAALKVAYEQYFLGAERQPPTQAYEALKKRVMKLKSGFVRSVTAKFRVQSLHNKFLSYQRLWQRTLQEMEAGTYRRDVFKAKRRAHKQTPAVPPGALPAQGVPGGVPPTPPLASAPGVSRGVPLTPALPLGATPSRGGPALTPTLGARPSGPGSPGVPPAAAGAGLSEEKLKAVYNAFVTAKRRCQEDTSKITYESVAASLRKQVPELMKQHNAKAVEFKVVIKDGKAVLKAVPE